MISPAPGFVCVAVKVTGNVVKTIFATPATVTVKEAVPAVSTSPPDAVAVTTTGSAFE